MIPKWIGVGVLLLIVGGWYSSQNKPYVPVTSTAVPDLAPEAEAEIKKRQAEKLKEDAEWRKAVIMARTLKGTMKNPDSFKLESLTRMADGSLCFSYRATNSFNAIVPGYAVASGSKFVRSDADDFSSLWNGKCAKKSGDDLTSVRMAM